MNRLLAFTATLFLVLATVTPLDTQAQTSFRIGPRVGVPFGDVSDLGGNVHLGADARIQLESLPDPVVLSPSFDYYLTDNSGGSGLSIFGVDLNGFYEFDVSNASFVPYAGGGLAVTRISIDVGAGFDPSSTEIGLNLVGGARFPLGSVEPFAQFNFAAGAERTGITGGILFSL